jgi:hypothetical protein
MQINIFLLKFSKVAELGLSLKKAYKKVRGERSRNVAGSEFQVDE